MAPVANPDTMSGPGSSSSKLSWPASVSLRLEELQESLEEEEITRKGYWKQKYRILEKFLSKDQLKKVSGLQTELKEGKVSDIEYFEKLQAWLVPEQDFVDEGVENEAEAMLWDENDDKKDDKKDDKNEGNKDEVPKKTEVESEGEEVPAASSSKPAEAVKSSRGKKAKNQPSIRDMFSRSAKRKSSAEISPTRKQQKQESEVIKTEEAAPVKLKETPPAVSTRCKICRQFLGSPDLVR